MVAAGRRHRMINYYRYSVRASIAHTDPALRPVKAPTLVIWGQRDRCLGPEVAEPDRDDVPDLDRVERLPAASHWVHHGEAERVNQLLTDFFAPALGRETADRPPARAVVLRRRPAVASRALSQRPEHAG